MRFAAKVMLVAFLLSIVAVGLQASNVRWPRAADGPNVALVLSVPFSLHGFLILGSLFAAMALFRVGPRFLIIFGIVSSFILSVDFAFQVLGSFIRLNNAGNLNLVGPVFSPIKQWLLFDALVFGSGTLACLLASILAISAINRMNAWRWYRRAVDLDEPVSPQMANQPSGRERAASAMRRAAMSMRVAIVISIGAIGILAIQIPWRVGMHPDIESGLLFGFLLDGMTIILVTLARGMRGWSRPSYWTKAGILGNLFLFGSFLIRILPRFIYLFDLRNNAGNHVEIYWTTVPTMLLNSLVFGIAAAANLVAANLAINWINVQNLYRQHRKP
ncbi:MAG: hypothetical protein EXS16_01930 [Gemmataceae bacterium]|nr:hypothetical protein [Gemmataceae bacterium]